MKEGENEYGTPIAIFTCPLCEHSFTTCPIPDDPENWEGACYNSECARSRASGEGAQLSGLGFDTPYDEAMVEESIKELCFGLCGKTWEESEGGWFGFDKDGTAPGWKCDSCFMKEEEMRIPKVVH